ncbi:ribonuclease T2 family protein [Aureimonas leprariae]|nr:ribonuclease [Aureimonas leprariae]
MKWVLALAAMFAASGQAGAQQASGEGYFIAKRACEATQSIRGGDGVQPATLTVDRAYRFVAENKQPASHYLIEIPDVSPNRRWVERDCGERVASVGAAASTGAKSSSDSTVSTRNILAISWQPAFCEGQSNKPECRSQTADRADASRFSLHGLWPQPRSKQYCGAAAGLKDKDKSPAWQSLPAPELSAETRRRLEAAMPGTQSFLDRHEWARHGTCYGRNADGYFTETLALLDAVNASPVAKLFADRVGKDVTAEEIRGAFDQAFGNGAGERVRIACRNDGDRRLVTELTIGLGGEVGATPDLPALLRAARPTKAGCPGGVVDAAGLQ